MDFVLKRASPIVGVIRAPDGAPLADAEIGISSSSPDPDFRLQFRIDKAHIVPNTDQYVPMKTDASGRFTFPSREGPLVMVVSHPRGIAIRRQGQLAGDASSPVDIVLEPWGRVEGTLNVSTGPARGETVSMSSLEDAGVPENRVYQHLEARTDEHGRFAFDQVLPGLMRLGHSIHADPGRPYSSTPVPAFAVNPGQTTRLELGRTGRPVIGRLAVPGRYQGRVREKVRGIHLLPTAASQAPRNADRR